MLDERINVASDILADFKKIAESKLQKNTQIDEYFQNKNFFVQLKQFVLDGILKHINPSSYPEATLSIKTLTRALGHHSIFKLGKINSQIANLISPEQQIQALKAECSDYKEHLKKIIRKDKYWNEFTLSIPIFNIDDHLQKPSKYTIDNDFLSINNKNYKLVDLATGIYKGTEQELSKTFPVTLYEALEKYGAMVSLETKLYQEKKSIPSILDDFRHDFHNNIKPVIEKRRNSRALKCIKALTSILTFGVAALAFYSFNKTQGKKTSLALDEIINGQKKSSSF